MKDFTCFGVGESSSVCNGIGKCIGPDLCQCNDQNAGANCISCPQSQFIQINGTSVTCQLCPNNTFWKNQISCNSCPFGSFSYQLGSLNCSNCSIGTYGGLAI